MSNSSTPLNIETYIRNTFLQEKYSQPFSKQKCPLTWKGNGAFEVDAVSQDGTIAALISTSTPKTSGGNLAYGKFHKIRSDALFLLHLEKVKKFLMVFTEEAMYDHFTKEQDKGRFPDGITLLFVPLPERLQRDVEQSRDAAAKEVGG